MTGQTVIVESAALRRVLANLLSAAGVRDEDSQIVADSVTTAELFGFQSHGVIRVPHYLKRLRIGSINKRPEIRVVQRSGNTAVVDGDHGLGHAVAHFAMREAIGLAESGVGVVGVRNSSHFGIAGYFALQAVRRDMIGVVVSHTDASVVPYGGRKPAVGTNPLAVAVPTDREYPVLLDMATSTASLGKVLVARDKGESIPPDWAVDEEGNPTTDPHRAKYLLPMAGPKGYGLALIFDILSGPLTGAAFGKHIPLMYGDYEKHRELGHFMGAINVERFVPVGQFKRNVGLMMDDIHATPPARGFDRVLVPGEREYLTMRAYERDGIPIPLGTMNDLRAAAKELEVRLDL